MIRFVALVAVLLAACSPAPAGDDPTTSTTEPPNTTTTEQPTGSSTSTSLAVVEVDYPVCSYDEPWPDAPADWYRDTPVYIGNGSPTDSVRRFASGIPGFETVWIDRDHNGWVSAGFVGVDIEAVQQQLESEFPDEGVVAVELFHTRAELEAMAAELHSQLPEDMHAVNVHEIYGRIEVFVGLLTPENIALVGEIAGEAPYCLEGLDPVLYDQGPQAPEGDGWTFLGVVDTSLESEIPTVMTDQTALATLWEELQLDGDVPDVDFETQVAIAFPLGYSGSCPDTRFDGFEFMGDRMMANIAHTTIAQACTADYNPRTYLIGVDREVFPAPPFFLVEWEHSSEGLRIDVDLSVPGAEIGPGQSAVVHLDRPRVATSMPLFMETGGFAWEFIVPADCDLSYIGEVNGVGWHLSENSAIPDVWADLSVDGLIDLQIELHEEPDPMVIVSGGGEQAVYVPGDKPTPDCRP